MNHRYHLTKHQQFSLVILLSTGWTCARPSGPGAEVLVSSWARDTGHGDSLEILWTYDICIWYIYIWYNIYVYVYIYICVTVTCIIWIISSAVILHTVFIQILYLCLDMSWYWSSRVLTCSWFLTVHLQGCSPVCGDGIVISPMEECDDNNNLSAAWNHP
jgi:hypothetical protein